MKNTANNNQQNRYPGIKYTFGIIVFLSLSLNCLSQKANTGNTGKDVTLKTGTGEIYGTLLVPERDKPVPVVLIISGSGPTDRNGNNPMMTNNSLKMTAEALFEAGIASLRYDKRGIAKSEKAGGDESKLRFGFSIFFCIAKYSQISCPWFSQLSLCEKIDFSEEGLTSSDNYIDDAAGWIEMLKNDKQFDKVIVLGHSEGSLIGMVAAGVEGVRAFISVAGAGKPADEILKEQLRTQPSYVKDLAYPIIDKLKCPALLRLFEQDRDFHHSNWPLKVLGYRSEFCLHAVKYTDRGNVFNGQEIGGKSFQHGPVSNQYTQFRI